MKQPHLQQTRPSYQQGFLSLEALFGMTLLLLVFLALIDITRVLWMQLRAEDMALTLALRAKSQPAVAGTSTTEPLGKQGSALIHWTDREVTAQVKLSVRGSALGPTVGAKRVLPRDI